MKKRKKNFTILSDDALVNILSYLFFHHMQKQNFRLISEQFNRVIPMLENKIINWDIRNLKKTKPSMYCFILTIIQNGCPCLSSKIHMPKKKKCVRCWRDQCLDCSKNCFLCKKEVCFGCYIKKRIKMCFSCKNIFCEKDCKECLRKCISCERDFCDKCLFSVPPLLIRKMVCFSCTKKVLLIKEK